MPRMVINDRTVGVREGLTILDAARAAGIDIPALCLGEGLPHVTSCMVCVVEDLDTGRLVPACSTPVADGMRVATDSARVVSARRAALELLLSDHVGDCEGPCRRGCPAGMDIPRMLREIAAGRMREAIRTVKEHIVLPAVLGRICPAPCEKVCRRGFHDAPVGICALKRFVADADREGGMPYIPVLPDATGHAVAVAGGGPAGLAAAGELRRRGHGVILFEMRPVAGGGLRAADLSPQVLDAEIGLLLALGIELRAGVGVGRDVSLESLKRDYDAVVLAIGTPAPDLPARFGLDATAGGFRVDRPTGRTSDPAVFACGHAVGPGRMAVRALAQGRTAAVAVDQMLRGQPVTGLSRGYDHRLVGRPDACELEAYLADADAGPRREPRPGAAGYDNAEAVSEARRCLHCDCRKPRSCTLRRYAAEYGARQHAWEPEERRRVRVSRSGGVIYEPGKCIACGICVRMAEREGEPLGLAFIGRGFDVRIGVPFNEPLERGLQKAAAACIAACPTGALARADGPGFRSAVEDRGMGKDSGPAP